MKERLRRRRPAYPALLACALAGCVLAGCGSPATVTGGASGNDAAGDAGSDATGGSSGQDHGSGKGSDLNVGSTTGTGGSNIPPEGLTELKLEVSVDQDSLVASGLPVAVTAHARYADGSKPASVVWSVDDTRLGSIDQQGVFEANGFTAGLVTISARAVSESASATLSITVAVVENRGAISSADQAKLVAGGSGGEKGVGPDSAFRFLYPYDNTVFPRGLPAPALQFGGAQASATYLSISTPGFSYAGFASAGTPTRFTLSESVWRGITYSAGPAAPVKVRVSELVDGMVTGPIEEQWSIAQGTLKGVIYYNTYRSLLAGSDGAVMRIRPGQSAEVLKKGCTVCHSVSARGNVLVAGVDWDDDPVDSEALDLLDDGSTKARRIVSEGRLFALGALTPDGKRLLVNGIPGDGPVPRGLVGPFASRLVDTKTGNTIPAASFTDQVKFAMTPNFSPDGAHVAFNNRDVSAGHTLSMMDYDGSTSPPTFSSLRELVTSPGKVVAWPSFLPDGKGIVFHEGDAFDTAQYQGGALYADLRLVGTDASAPKALAQLNGYDASNASTLPYGDAEEGHLDYEPSVLPVPVGGYYWVLFTSRRAYGNTIAPNGTLPRGNDKWGKPQGDEVESPSPRKKIWLAPIDLDYQTKLDPSHPAIYLPGQELESGNMRAFAALEPCRGDGGGCESAAECCTGFCRQTAHDDTGPVLTCVPPPANTCSNEDEACGVAADCCDKLELCINKRCASPSPEEPPIH